MYKKTETDIIPLSSLSLEEKILSCTRNLSTLLLTDFKVKKSKAIPVTDHEGP
jgi:hypothetical protein